MKKNEGITLVALVITIVVLLILVTTSISIVVGENGIIKSSIKATKSHKVDEFKAQVENIMSGFTMDYIKNDKNIIPDKVVSELQNLGTVNKISNNNIKIISREDENIVLEIKFNEKGTFDIKEATKGSYLPEIEQRKEIELMFDEINKEGKQVVYVKNADKNIIFEAYPNNFKLFNSKDIRNIENKQIKKELETSIKEISECKTLNEPMPILSEYLKENKIETKIEDLGVLDLIYLECNNEEVENTLNSTEENHIDLKFRLNSNNKVIIMAKTADGDWAKPYEITNNNDNTVRVSLYTLGTLAFITY